MTNNLAPDVREAAYGIREIKTLKVYPLAIGHQMEAVEMFQDILTIFIQEKERFKSMKDAEFIPVLMNMLKNSFVKILSFTVDEDPEMVLSNITNNQLVDLGMMIYEVNYKVPFGKLKEVFPPTEQLKISGHQKKRKGTLKK